MKPQQWQIDEARRNFERWKMPWRPCKWCALPSDGDECSGCWEVTHRLDDFLSTSKEAAQAVFDAAKKALNLP